MQKSLLMRITNSENKRSIWIRNKTLAKMEIIKNKFLVGG